jgi:hypothetical protein
LIQCEHFIYALFNEGYKLHATPNLKKLLNDDNLKYLCHIGDKTKQETVVQVWFPTENLLSVSSIHQTSDKYGRKGIWNHTILVSAEDYFQLTQPSTIFKPYFLKELPAELPLTAIQIGKEETKNE